MFVFFRGDYCEEDIDECAVQPCKNNGTCKYVRSSPIEDASFGAKAKKVQRWGWIYTSRLSTSWVSVENRCLGGLEALEGGTPILLLCMLYSIFLFPIMSIILLRDAVNGYMCYCVPGFIHICVHTYINRVALV